MLVEMSHVFVVGLKKDLKPILDTIQDYGKVHLSDTASKLLGGDLTPAELDVSLLDVASDDQFDTLSQRGDTLVAGLQEQLGITETEVVTSEGENPYAGFGRSDLVLFAEAFFDSIEPQAKKLAEKMEEVSRQAAELERFGPVLEKIGSLVQGLVTPDAVDSVALMFEKRYRAALPELDRTIGEIAKGHARVVSAEIPNDDSLLVMVLIDDERYSKKLRQYLVDEGMNRVSLPGGLQHLPFTLALEKVSVQYKAMPAVLEGAKQQVREFYTDHVRKIEWLCALMRTEDESVGVKYSESAFSFVLEGYLPTCDLDQFQKLMAETWGDAAKVDVVDLDPSEYSKVPVQLDNKGKTKFFEGALGIWGQPMYGSFDPTIILRYSFPLVFGLIVGDAGYGLLLFLICWFAGKKFKDNYGVQMFTNVLKPAGIMAMVFGVLYFEFFGNLAHVYIPGLNQIHPIMFGSSFGLPFLRTEPALQTTYLFIAIGFGFLQVCFGLVLGIINMRKLGHNKHVWEKAGILTVLFAAILMVVIKMVPALTVGLPDVVGAIVNYLVYIAIAVGVVSLLFGGGIMGAIETLETISHIASYIRIMAVGLAGALLADAANKLAFVAMPNAGGVAIVIVLHVVNFAIICFSPSIHALRLNFLEFFGKFWEAGTVTYKPFARKEGQS